MQPALRGLSAALVASLVCACGASGGASRVADAGNDVTATDASEASSPADAAPTDATATPETGADAAPRAHIDASALALPGVLDFDGGVIASPTLVAVTFPGDDQAAAIDAFTAAVGASAYWRDVTGEYGVGPAGARTIHETEPAPASVNANDDEAESWLTSRFDGTHPEWGAFDPNAVYLVFYPASTAAVQNVGGCGGAYHASLPISLLPAEDGSAPAQARMIYGVVFRCAQTIDVGRPTGFALTTFMASHEMVEAVTDPYGDAFAAIDEGNVAWSYFAGSEVADMCAFHAGAAIEPADLGYTVQRSWSNRAAARFVDPCVPPASDPFFVAAPLDEKAIALASLTGRVATNGFNLRAGASITINVGFFGAAAGSWTVTPFTYAREHGTADPYLQFFPAVLTGEAGDVASLTITRLAEDPDGNGGDAVKLVSTLGAAENEWFFAVTN